MPTSPPCANPSAPSDPAARSKPFQSSNTKHDTHLPQRGEVDPAEARSARRIGWGESLHLTPTSKGHTMTLQPSDFTAAHNFFLADDYKAEVNETAKSRAHILCALDAASAAVAESGGDPDKEERALAAQVAALDAIFRQYARIAALNTDLMSVQTYMRFALKAQAQSRVTFADLERKRSARAAAAAKPPRPSAPPAKDSQNAANELLR